MIIRKLQKCKGFHRPVGRTGPVITLSHYQIRIPIPNCQNTVPVKYRLLHPVLQMTDYQSLNHPHRKGIYPRHQAGRPKADLSKPISKRTSKRQGCSLFIKPIDKGFSEQHCPFFIDTAALRVLFLHDAGIKKAVKMNSKRNIIILLSGIAILIPSITQIEFFHALKIYLQLFTVIFPAAFHQGHIHQYRKQNPITYRKVIIVNAVQPAAQKFLSRFRKRIPQLLRSEDQPISYRRHLDEFLVKRMKTAPEFRITRIGTGFQALPVYFFKPGFFSASRPERHQSP